MSEINSSPTFGRSFLIMLATALAAGAVFYVLREHGAHALGLAAYLLFLACPLMHIFMHGGHGEHRHGHASTKNEKADS